MQAGRAGDGNRCGRVPLVLAAGVQVGVGVATDDSRDLRSGGTDRHDRAAQRRGHRADHRRRPGSAGHQPRATHRRGTVRQRRTGRQRDALRRQGDRPHDQVAVLPQRDVHGPVEPALLAELTGSVQRIDDPYPPGGQPRRVVDRFL